MTHSTLCPAPLFFIGIGGIGMSALARYYLHYGYPVAGYDRTETPITRRLVELGATIFYTDDAAGIPETFRSPDTTVIYTPAIPRDNAVRLYYEKRGYTLHKRAEVLGEISRRHKALCVAGTHGKTSTTTLLAHLLASSHMGANAFLGGLSLNYDSNLLLDEHSPYVVIEADEYDRSFHQLRPHAAIITSVSPDHLDIYHTEEAFREAFEHFASLVDPDGLLLVEEHARLSDRSDKNLRPLTYGASSACDFFFDRSEYREGELYFDWHSPTGSYRDLLLGTPIEVNLLNATAAIALAQHCGCTEEELRHGLATFRGVHRRFERILNTPSHPILIDDYAHHPEEISASLDSIRRLYPGHHLTVIFQPHLYSRTADFTEEFGRALSSADRVILLDIYPARELPIPGVTSGTLLQHISTTDKRVCPKEELIEVLDKKELDVVVTMGAGDIEFEVDRVRDFLSQKERKA